MTPTLQHAATQLMLILAVLCTGGFVAAFALAIYDLLLRRFFEEVRKEKSVTQRDFITSLRGVALSKLATLNTRVVPPPYLARVKKQLIRAGAPHELTPEEFAGLQEVSAFGFLLFAMFLSITVQVGLLWWPPLVALGVLYPWIWLRDLVNRRLHDITRALPYNLDLLTLSVEAGLDFAAAIGKVVEKGRKGPLVDEFAITLKTLKMGKTREDALKAMAERVNLPALNSFVNALVQADKMGTSLGKILRIQSTQMRVERTQRAEKLANEAPVKLLFPLILFIFPTVFMILFGPIIYQMMSGAMTA